MIAGLGKVEFNVLVEIMPNSTNSNRKIITVAKINNCLNFDRKRILFNKFTASDAFKFVLK